MRYKNSQQNILVYNKETLSKNEVNNIVVIVLKNRLITKRVIVNLKHTFGIFYFVAVEKIYLEHFRYHNKYVKNNAKKSV